MNTLHTMAELTKPYMFDPETLETKITFLEKKLNELKSKRSLVKFMKMCEINDESQLKRVSNLEIQPEYSYSNSEYDEYASEMHGKLTIKYNYSMIDFISPTEVKINVYKIKFSVLTVVSQTYQNKEDPEKDMNITTEVKDEGGRSIPFTIDDEEDSTVSEPHKFVDHDKTNGNWAFIINKFYDYCHSQSFDMEDENSDIDSIRGVAQISKSLLN